MPQVVLFQPQIPPNTGNIARTCAATATPLHLVGPLGFEISDRYLKRAGLDYWPYVDLHLHDTWETFQSQHFGDRLNPGRILGFSTRGKHNYSQFSFQGNDWLLFGRETTGLPETILNSCTETLFIPMDQSHVRSLNLSVSVAIALFEARRQLGLSRTPAPQDGSA